jgi:hypothetical protein
MPFFEYKTGIVEAIDVTALSCAQEEIVPYREDGFCAIKPKKLSIGSKYIAEIQCTE